MTGPEDNPFGFPPENTDKISNEKKDIEPHKVGDQEANNYKKLLEMLDSLNAVKASLRRQESEDRSPAIDPAGFSVAVANLEAVLEQNSSQKEEISQALRRLIYTITQTGERPRVGRSVQQTTENIKRVVFSLRNAVGEVQSLSRSFREDPEIYLPLVKLEDAMEEKVSTLLRAIGNLKANDRRKDLLD